MIRMNAICKYIFVPQIPLFEMETQGKLVVKCLEQSLIPKLKFLHILACSEIISLIKPYLFGET